MKLRSKKGWKSNVPLILKGKFTTRFSLFAKVDSTSYSPGKTQLGTSWNNNRQATMVTRTGSVCNCILPEALRISAVRHDPNFQPLDSEKRKLRGTFNCLSSVSMRQKQSSTSSLFIQSPLRGCLSSWELRQSINRSLKER
ncbi:hypothetical protein L6164_024738 [Bauhinia variegata]|uniref:Uncharacterized protein n=1 Tax=Bauhinia variegata TaxID=167791 RepID=A0ACB9LYQ0_BAUVA|nr:hypothetical protein L6164_024738 [Bauhinia variegata]